MPINCQDRGLFTLRRAPVQFLSFLSHRLLGLKISLSKIITACICTNIKMRICVKARTQGETVAEALGYWSARGRLHGRMLGETRRKDVAYRLQQAFGLLQFQRRSRCHLSIFSILDFLQNVPGRRSCTAQKDTAVSKRPCLFPPSRLDLLAEICHDAIPQPPFGGEG